MTLFVIRGYGVTSAATVWRYYHSHLIESLIVADGRTVYVWDGLEPLSYRGTTYHSGLVKAIIYWAIPLGRGGGTRIIARTIRPLQARSYAQPKRADWLLIALRGSRMHQPVENSG